MKNTARQTLADAILAGPADNLRYWQVSTHPQERGLRKILEGLAQYADGFKRECGIPLGEDYVIGDEWITALRAFIGLLNGPSGRLNCGTLDTAARDLAEHQGFTRDLEQP